MSEPEPLLLDAAAVCKLLTIAPRTLRALRSGGRLPQPVALLRRSPRWRRADLEVWVKGGCRAPWGNRQ